MDDRICRLEGCEKRIMPRSRPGALCAMHESRMRRTGTYEQRQQPTAPRGHSHGYKMVQRRGHVLEDKNGSVFVHRLVLFDAIGYGPHRCHWCAAHINWHAGLECDHLDRDRANNDRENLNPSCHGCNVRRAKHRNQFSTPKTAA